MADELSEKALQARRKYQREWKKANRDKVRQYNRSYWEKKANKEQKEGNQ